MASTVILTSVLQLYNWFANRDRVLAAYISAELCAYMLESFLTKSDKKQPIFYYLCGSIFVLIALIDKYTFLVHPASVKLILEQTDENNHEVRRGINGSIIGEDTTKTVRIDQSVIEVRPITYSFMSVLKIPDVVVLIKANFCRAMAVCL